jgi:L-fucose isomerase-like protein
LIDKVDENEAGRLADEVIKGASLVREPPREQTVLAARVHLANLEMMRREKANAIAIDCIAGHKDMGGGGYPCISFSKLNDQGLYGVCEADTDSAVTMMMVTSFSGKPGFITDPVFDLSENEVHHLHCTSATAMQGVGGPGFPYILRGYPYSGDINATCIQVLFGGRGPITLAKFSGPQVLFVSTGEVMGNIDVDRGCRNKMRTRVSDAQKLLRNWSLVNIATDQRPARSWDFRQETMEGLHRVVFYGDHVEMIERLGRLTGFRVFHEL